MKAFLAIVLLALVSCEKTETPIDVIKCLITSDVILQAIPKIVEAIKSQNIMTIITTIMQLYPSVFAEIKRCLGMALSAIPEWVIALAKIIGEIVITWWENGGAEYVKKMCIEQFGEDSWICKLIPA